jgi:hypothetical protein
MPLSSGCYPETGAVMSETNCYVFTTEPEGASYVELVAFCCSLASKMILVKRDPDIGPGAGISEKLAQLSEFQIGVALAREWPGTTLYGHEALIYSYRVAPGLSNVLQVLASHLFAWMHPEAPEDMCFFRESDRVLLVTTSHEADAYLYLSAGEFQNLTTRAPHMAAILRLEGSVS